MIYNKLTKTWCQVSHHLVVCWLKYTMFTVVFSSIKLWNARKWSWSEKTVCTLKANKTWTNVHVEKHIFAWRCGTKSSWGCTEWNLAKIKEIIISSCVIGCMWVFQCLARNQSVKPEILKGKRTAIISKHCVINQCWNFARVVEALKGVIQVVISTAEPRDWNSLACSSVMADIYSR